MGDTPLDRLDKQVRERYQREQDKIDSFNTQREVERIHSRITRPDLICSTSFTRNRSFQKQCSPHRKEKTLYKCDIVNCDVQFDTRFLYEGHIRGKNHSPCNPLKYIINGKLPESRTAHMCSECGQIYRDYSSCKDHMKAMSHDFLQVPLRLAGYVCPQCLSVFSDKSSCDEHMESMKHCYFQYPFKDDMSAQSACGPVPLPESTLKLFSEKCSEVSYFYSCTKCQDNPHVAHQVHNKKQVLADMTHGEVFAIMMKSHSCVQCLRLFDNIRPEDLDLGIHYCSETDVGMYIENDCKTFSEFVRRLALPVNETPVSGGHASSTDGIVATSRGRDIVRGNGTGTIGDISHPGTSVDGIASQGCDIVRKNYTITIGDDSDDSLDLTENVSERNTIQPYSTNDSCHSLLKRKAREVGQNLPLGLSEPKTCKKTGNETS